MFDPRDDARDRDGREDSRERVYDERDRDDDPREGLMRHLDLPRGQERELVVVRDHVHELDGEDSRTLAAVGAFRVVPEHVLDIDHGTLDHLRDEGLVETVDLGDDERGLTLTREGRDLLDSHSIDRNDEPSQAFYAGVSREREVDHDSNLYATYRQEEARLRDEHDGLEVRRVVLEQDLKREYQEFLQEHNRGCADSDGRPDRNEDEIREWAREHDLPYFVVYNLTRFAREKYDHFALRAHLKSLGISLRPATEPIDDTSTGKLMEGVLAAFAQFDNDVRSDRTRAGMKAALALGRWTFPAPLGYLNAPKGSSASLVHDPERGPLVRRAFEDLATGQYTKQEVIARATAAGLRSRKGLALSPQSFGQIMRNPIYIGKIESPDYGVSVHGDFEPVVDEATFYRAQAVLDGRVVVSGPRQRNHPDFPLRGFVRCDVCGRPLTGSWSKGRNGHYAYYHCQRQCRAVNVSKAALEGAFVDELALLQPTPGYMRLVKDRILHVWEQRRAEVNDRTTEQQRRVSAIQQKMDKLDEAFLYAEAIDVTTYGRQRDKLREELTLAKIDHHAEAVDELDVEGILAFAERILPRASDLWVQASLDYKQRLQLLFCQKELRTTEIDSIEPP